jgi:hypothetical protein
MQIRAQRTTHNDNEQPASVSASCTYLDSTAFPLPASSLQQGTALLPLLLNLSQRWYLVSTYHSGLACPLLCLLKTEKHNKDLTILSQGREAP